MLAAHQGGDVVAAEAGPARDLRLGNAQDDSEIYPAVAGPVALPAAACSGIGLAEAAAELPGGATGPGAATVGAERPSGFLDGAHAGGAAEPAPAAGQGRGTAGRLANPVALPFQGLHDIRDRPVADAVERGDLRERPARAGFRPDAAVAGGVDVGPEAAERAAVAGARAEYGRASPDPAAALRTGRQARTPRGHEAVEAAETVAGAGQAARAAVAGAEAVVLPGATVPGPALAPRDAVYRGDGKPVVGGDRTDAPPGRHRAADRGVALDMPASGHSGPPAAGPQLRTAASHRRAAPEPGR